MALSGRIGSVSQIKGSISSGNELVVTRIVGRRTRCIWFFGKQHCTITRCGCYWSCRWRILQYRASDQKFVARNTLDTTSGTLVFSGGGFN